MHSLVNDIFTKSGASLLGNLASVPLATLVESDALASKDVQGAPYGEIDFAIAEALHELQILNIPATTGVRDRDRADFRQKCDQSLIDAGLQTFGIGSMDQKFTTVRLERGNVVYRMLAYHCDAQAP